MYKCNIVLLFIFIICSNLYSISNGQSKNIWNLKSIDGIIGIESYYTKKMTIFTKSKISDNPESYEFLGKGLLNLKNYILHPSFIGLDISMEYNPGTYKENFLILPDRSDVKTAEKIDLRTSIFNERPLRFSFFGNYGHSFINREFSSDMESKSISFGGNISFANGYLPLSMSYNNSKSKQVELGINRRFLNEQKNLSLDLNKSFDFHNHSLNCSYIDNQRTEYSSISIGTKDLNINLRDHLFFDLEQQNIVTSNIVFLNTSGNTNLTRINVMENLKLELPLRFSLTGNYDLTKITQQNSNNSPINSLQHNISGGLSHQLYLSLNNYASHQITNITHSSYNESRNSSNFGFRYKKMIPTNGLLRLNYNINYLQENRQSVTQLLEIFDEVYTLSDNQASLIRTPDIVFSSLKVTDGSQLIIYKENIDYLLIQRGRFIEIQRLPGGLIDNAASVLVDYVANYDESYKYVSLNQSFSGSINLFERFFEFYFSGMEQNFLNTERTELLTLQLISQKTYGSKIYYEGFETGLEFQEYKTNITPYKYTHYFVNYSDFFWERLLISFSGNYRNQTYLETLEKQNYGDISGKIDYRISEMFNFKLDGGYLMQEGRGLDLKLLTLRTELGILFRAMNIKLGVENYQRNQLGEILNYVSGYAKIERKF